MGKVQPMKNKVKRNRNIHNRRFFLKLMGSFVIMLFLPVLLAVANYVWSRGLMEEETVQYHQALLSQAQQVIDEKLQGVQMYAFELSQNESLNHFLGQEGMEYGELLVEVNKVKKQLQRFQVLYPGVKNAAVYAMKHQTGISGTAVCWEAWPQSAVKLLRGDTEEWKKRAFTDEEHEILRYLEEENLYCRYVPFRGEDGTGQRVILIHSLPIWSSGLSYEGVLVAEIDMEGLLRGAGEDVEQAGGFFGILDANGQIVAGIGNQALTEQASDVRGQEHYLITNQASAVNKWNYVMIQPNTAFVHKLRSYRNFTLLMLGVLLALGACLAYGLSRNNYRPMKGIMERLKKGRNQPSGDGDEFTYIESALDELEQSVQEVHAVMERQIPRIRSSMLQSLLANTVTDYEEFAAKLEECGVVFRKAAYTVAIVHIQQFPTQQMDKQVLLKMFLWEQVKEILGPVFSCSMVDMPEDNLVLIINGDREGLKEQVLAYLQQLMARARKELEMLLVIAVGTPVDGLEHLSSVYQEALVLLGNQRGRERFGAVLTTEKKEAFRLYSCSAEVRNRISNYVMAGREDLACQVLEENYHENFDNRQVDRAVAVGYFILLIDVILNCYSVSEKEKQRLWDQCNPVAALLAEETPEAMELIVKGFAQLVGHYVRQRRENHADSMKARILQYIREKYSDNNLSLSYVADYFLITPNYLSAFFKEQVGDTFLNYLTRVRLDQAKKLLVETDYAVSVIAGQVGYASANTFIRTFKKTEHMTPGEYREYARQRAKQ